MEFGRNQRKRKRNRCRKERNRGTVKRSRGWKREAVKLCGSERQSQRTKEHVRKKIIVTRRKKRLDEESR